MNNYILNPSFRPLFFFLLLSSGLNYLCAQEASEKKEDSLQLSLEKTRDQEEVMPGALFQLGKSSSTAAVSSTSGEILYKTPVANLSNTLYGLLPGLTVSQGSGEPGKDAANLKIRGVGSYNYGDYAVFVDGFQTTFNYLEYLSPAEIESFSILKDAAALAPFGMKGANGVIWVTTKKGTPGKMNVKLQARTGFQEPINLNKPVGSYDYARLYNEAISNDNGRIWSPVYSETQLEEYKNGTGINTSWYDEVLSKGSAFTTTDASISGGNDGARYFVMMSYMKDQGLYNVNDDDTHANANLEQFNLRANLDFSLFEIFEGKVNIGGRTEDRSYPNYESSALWENLSRYPSNIYPARNEDGTFPGTNTYPDNPLASINELGYISNHDRSLQANFNLKEKLDFITPGLYLSEAVSFSTWTRGTYNVTRNYSRIIDNEPQTTDRNSSYSIHDDRGTNQWKWTQFQGQVGYERTFGIHGFTGAVNYWNSMRIVDADRNGAAGVNIEYAFQNLGGRFHYEYDKRYAAEFGFSYSGSDNFAEGNRFGFYPAISVAWNISNESFLEKNERFNFLKLRASAGKTGYDSFSGGRYLYQQYYNYGASYLTGTGEPSSNWGLSPNYIPNPDIFAEESFKYNIGLDAKAFNSLNITLEGFLDKRSNIVTPDESMLAVFGANPPFRNLGEVTTKGFETKIIFHNQVGTFRYQIGGQASYNINKINYMAEVPPATPTAARTGRSIGVPFGYEAIGFYDVEDFDNEGNLRTDLPTQNFGELQPGDIRYRDINGDNIVDERDVVEIGDAYLPKLNYAFNFNAEYAGLDLRVILQGMAGRNVNLLDARTQVVAFQDFGNVHELARERWAYYPEEGIDTRSTATYPRLSTLDNKNNYRNSTFWIKNGNFLRLRNFELGYSLPDGLTNNLKLSDARFFLNAINFFTWSPFLKEYNIDPETMTGYPALKSFNAGFTLNFN